MDAPRGIYPVLKRLLDIMFAAGGILVTVPILLIVGIAIKIDSPGPVIFKQKRVGRDCQLFDMYKFRTMRVEAPSEVPTHEFSGGMHYVTPVGRVLRKTSADELPQLWNILRGDMSFVGPRPALWNQHDLIGVRENYGANSVRPGLTGWAQINGRDELSISEKAALDGQYVLGRGILLDAKCILGTVVTVVRADGVRDGGGVCTESSTSPPPPNNTPVEPASTEDRG